MITDLGIEQARTRDWMVTRIAVRGHRRLGRRGPVHVVDWDAVAGLTPSALAMPGQGVAQLLEQFDGRRAVDVADAIRGLPPKRRVEVFKALDDDRLADILQELPEPEQAEALAQLGTERAADVLEEMDPDDAADLLGMLNPTDAEMLLTRMDPEESDPVRRLLTYSPDTAGGLMTSDPVVLTPDTAVAEALARVRDPDLTPGAVVDGVRDRTADGDADRAVPGLLSLQRLLREEPARLVGGIVDSDLLTLTPRDRAGRGDPLLRRLQPGVRAGGRRPKPPAGGGDRGRPARSSAAARLARGRTGARHRPAITAERPEKPSERLAAAPVHPADVAPAVAAT